MAVLGKPAFTAADYLAWEAEQTDKHEYFAGDVFAMAGAGDAHVTISLNVAAALHAHLRGKPCRTYIADMKVRLAIAGKPVFYYPDMVAVCDPTDREPYFIAAPCLIVEVLSESTERIDRREKFLSYQTLPSLQAYWLVAQDASRVEVFRRCHDWQPEYFTSGEIPVDCLEHSITVEAIHRDIEE